MPRFFRRLAEGVFDEEDLVHRTHDLADFIERAASHYGFAADKIVAAGLSNGANIAAGLLLLRPKTLRAAVLFRPMVPLVPEELPDLSDVDVWIGVGNQDPIIPVSETWRLIGLLQKAKARVTPSFVNAGHRLTNGEVEGARGWLAELADGAR
jgi:predicted esterase